MCPFANAAHVRYSPPLCYGSDQNSKFLLLLLSTNAILSIRPTALSSAQPCVEDSGRIRDAHCVLARMSAPTVQYLIDG